MILSEKYRLATTPAPLTSRPLDLLYFSFFLIHIPASLLVDFQTIYPSWLAPSFMRALPEFYVRLSNDPLIGGMLGFFGNNNHLAWFKSFLGLELLFQLPVFFIGMRGLKRGSRSIYVLLLVYAASTATTTLACIAAILTTPTTNPAAIVRGQATVTPEQRLLLLFSYVPFFLVPFAMVVDMSIRVLALVKVGIKAEDAAKQE